MKCHDSAGLKMDLEDDTASIFGKEVTLKKKPTSDHYSALIKVTREVSVTKLFYT